ncbi:glutaminase [uncultured Microbacterium sp.]|uniref:glutaminase n=1 Tax=uncultured Microbacterium sp. TaxID=191216 RepID=UPI0028D3790C|nr:glutaminase [uncultured Microbacterium sp.]
MSTRALLDRARTRLAGAPREALGEVIVPRRVFGIGRSPRIVRRGEAWHLGVLLLTNEHVLATGDIVRARQEARRGFAAESQRQRAELAAAARRGGIAEGEVVHIGWTLLDPDAVDAGAASGPFALRGGVPSVRWSAAGGYMPLESYLGERVELLLNPPAGA